MRAHGGDDRLQIVAILAGDADGIALDLRRDLQFGVADEGGDLFGDGLFEALFYFDDLAGVAERGQVGRDGLDAFEADAALGQLADDHFVEGGNFKAVRGGKLDFIFFEDDFGVGAFKIEPVGQFLFGLVDGVVNLHWIDQRNDVE